MRNLKRAISLALRNRWTFAASVVCALAISVLWGGNIGTVFPFAEVVFKGQSMQHWVDDSIAQAQQQERQLGEQIDALRESAQPEQHAREIDRLQVRRQAERRAVERYQAVRPWIYRFLPRDPFKTLACIVGLLLAGTIIKGAFVVMHALLVARITQRTTFRLRKLMYRRTLRMDVAAFGEQNSAELVSRFSYDVEGLSSGLSSLLGKTIRELLKAIACLVGAAWICWRLLVLSLVIAPVAAVLIGRLGKLLKKANRRAMQEMAQLGGVLEESFQGIKVVKAFTMERHERRRMHHAAKSFLQRVLRIIRYESLTRPLTETMGIATISLALLSGAYLVLNQQTHLLGIRMSDRPLSLGALLVFYGLLAGISDPFRKLAEVFSRMQRAVAAADRIYALIDRAPRIEDPAQPKPLPRHGRSLVVRDVSFAYEPEQPVLQNIDLEIAFGETIALVGPNGCGKSTLANLIPRFYDPTEGRVELDGINLRDVRLRDLRRQIGLVTQEPMLFNDTVEANIRYGTPAATFEEIQQAARRAHAHQFIEERLSDGYQTVVGQLGGQLSGGQRQRIALARAILRDPSLLILDEATSQVDVESEQLIVGVLSQFVKQRTTVLITHRMALLALADRIVVMKAGRILDVGTHNELLGRCELYGRLYEVQIRDIA